MIVDSGMIVEPGVGSNSREAVTVAGVLRRRLLSVAASSMAAWAARALAQQKVSQAVAQYQDRPKNGLSCAACALFRPPAACAVVTGVISPNGWCRFFDLPD